MFDFAASSTVVSGSDAIQAQRLATCLRRVLACPIDVESGDDADSDLLRVRRAADGQAALVAVVHRVDREWPSRVRAARTQLDPERRLPLFAVSVTDGGGVDELAQWCVQSQSTAQADRTIQARRMAGARVGFAELRAHTFVGLRSGAQELATITDDVCRRVRPRDLPLLSDWLSFQLQRYVQVIGGHLDDGVDRVRSAAAAPVAAEPVNLPAPERPRLATARTLSAEDFVMLILGASAGLGLGRLFMAPLTAWAGLGGAGAVLTVVAGLVLGAAVVSLRRTSALRAQARQQCAEAIGTCRAVTEQAVATAIGGAEARLIRASMEPRRAPVRPTL